MVRATGLVAVLVVLAGGLFADSQSTPDPVEAPPPANVAAKSTPEDGIDLAGSRERIEGPQQRIDVAQLFQAAEDEDDELIAPLIEELRQRIEAARQRARAEAERLRRVQEDRENAARLQRELQERQERAREQHERARRLNQERARERDRHIRDREDEDPQPIARGSTTRTLPVADLLATLPGRRAPMFESPEDLIAALKAVSGTENWEHEGGITINRRALTLTVLHRREIVWQVQRQIHRFRQRSDGSLRITLRILIVPDNALVGLARDRAMLVSSEERALIYEKFQGEVEESDSRDYKHRYTTLDGGILYVWTAAKTEIDATHRGVNVVCEIEPGGNSVKITPIPFAGDENEVNWRPLSVAAGQSVVYELPAVDNPGDEHDTVRALAIVTVDAISPAAE